MLVSVSSMTTMFMAIINSELFAISKEGSLSVLRTTPHNKVKRNEECSLYVLKAALRALVF